MKNKADESYSEEEARHRFEAALRGARMVGHKPQSEMKLGKLRTKTSQSPGGRKASPKRKST
jgi:hypothetical protein